MVVFFRCISLRYFQKCHPADKKLDWVMVPGDPNQADSEITMYHLDEYIYTYIQMSKTIFSPFTHSYKFSNVSLSMAMYDCC